MLLLENRTPPILTPCCGLVHERYIPNKFLILADGAAGQKQIGRWLPFVEFSARATTRPRPTSAKTMFADSPHRTFRLLARILDGQEPQ
ncbi:MAG: hypothetical protein HY646_15990 [Acidobacteria bacterium]|nr:hypothetical protein [Acidobacteriota bacterium]